MIRPFALTPLRLPTAEIEALRRLQPLFNKLYDGVSRDGEFIEHVFGRAADKCAWVEAELDVYRRTAVRAAEKPRLLLPNSVYLQQTHSRQHVLSVGNVQAGEPFQVELVHSLQRAESSELMNGPLRTVAATLARWFHLALGNIGGKREREAA